jgi:hypothetical protein
MSALAVLRAKAFLFSSRDENIRRSKMARKALCVGINQFRNYPNNGLNGCVNDVKDKASVLTDFLGFTSWTSSR